MDISSTELRYNTKDVFAALKRNETVRIFRRGKLMGEIMPKRNEKNESLTNHPFFGSLSADDITSHPSFGCIRDNRPIEEIMRELRKPREFNDIV